MFRVEQSLPAPVTSVLRRGSAVTYLQGLRVRIQPGPVCLSLVSVECCQRTVRLAEHSFGGVLLSLSLSVILKPR